MRATSLFLFTFLAVGSSAVRFPAKARRGSVGISVEGVLHNHPTSLAGNGAGEIKVRNRRDLAYSTVIKLGGKEYGVQIDTGSSDLWVYSPKDPVNIINTTLLSIGLTYGKGSVHGDIDLAEFEVGDYKVPLQAFVNVDLADDFNGLFATGSSGILGLSFDGSSGVDGMVKAASDDLNSTAGRTPISNIFHQNPHLPNFISVLLGRTGDLDDEVEGLFTIAEYVEEFKTIENTPKIPRQIVKTDNAISRWNAEIQGITVNGRSVPLVSAFPGVEPNTAIGLLDTGYSFPPVAVSIADAIYSSIPGSVQVSIDGTQTWVVPCLNTTQLVIKIGGQDFPVHPLDLTYVNKIEDYEGKEYAYCTNTFHGMDVAERYKDVDMILGDSFLKNVYAVFDWGNESDGGNEEPFMQLLSTTTFDEAMPEFLQVRAESLKSMPRELSPTDLLALLGYEEHKSSASASGSSGANKPKVNLANGESSNSHFNDLLEKVGGYAPIIVGLLAGNMLLLVILTTIGLATCIRRGGQSRSAPAYIPVKLKDTETHPGQGTAYNTSYNSTGYHD